MMRSMYSAVAGLKTHQTRMDVIGNNIANVNTVGFKASKVTFQDMLYQNTSNASGADATNGKGGVNAKQIGLGVSTGATKIDITNPGAAENTGDGFDLRLTDMSTTHFFIVNNGSENVFTRSGSFYVDGAGNLAMTSTGYTVMGWQVDPLTGEIRKDTVSPLRIMSPENMTSDPEATTYAFMSGVVDKNDSDVKSAEGLVRNLTFYDKLGYSYTARFRLKSTGEEGEFFVELESILDSQNNEIYPGGITGITDEQKQSLWGNPSETVVQATYDSYDLKSGFSVNEQGQITIGDGGDTLDFADGKFTGGGKTYEINEVFDVDADYLNKLGDPASGFSANFDQTTGKLTISGPSINYPLRFSPADGSFVGINGMSSVTLNLASSGLFEDGNFEDISIDFSGLVNADNGGKTTAAMTSGNVDNPELGKGKKLGALIGMQVDQNGRIYASYDNGNTVLLGQIAVAQFANASGLEKVGENCYSTTLNSGDFDGIGVEISSDGSKMSSGELEMSNVDLASEFTYMITTQRGFQANSRVITTSDTLLEELVNLKR